MPGGPAWTGLCSPVIVHCSNQTSPQQTVAARLCHLRHSFGSRHTIQSTLLQNGARRERVPTQLRASPPLLNSTGCAIEIKREERGYHGSSGPCRHALAARHKREGYHERCSNQPTNLLHMMKVCSTDRHDHSALCVQGRSVHASIGHVNQQPCACGPCAGHRPTPVKQEGAMCQVFQLCVSFPTWVSCSGGVVMACNCWLQQW